MSTPTLAHKRWLKRATLLLLAFLVVVALMRLFGSMDWDAVGAALAHLSWWQPLVLLLVLCARQIANAAPLHYYIDGISLYRATLNDLSATMLTAFAPPPSDMALRVAMFTSWGVKLPLAIAGTTMNAMTFFIVRFATPLAGFALAAVAARELGIRWLDVISLAIAAALIAIVLLMTRSQATARNVGRICGNLARRITKGVDPRHWEEQCVMFQQELSARFGYAFPRSLAVSFAMVFFDGLLLLLALRFVGLDASLLPTADVAIAFLFAFPLTAMPMSGMGAMDVLVAASCISVAGEVIQEPLLAALIIWRLFNVAGPLLLGVAAAALWKTGLRKNPRPPAAVQ